MSNSPLFIVVDLFCGAGGTTTGFVQAALNGYELAKVIACVNHDPIAIKSHWANHKEVKHFEEDIRTLNVSELIALVQYYKTLYPDAYVILWASLECTNFSKAKGGMERDEDSRTLAKALYMHWMPDLTDLTGKKGEYVEGDSYIQCIDPDYIMIENVVEFMAWGPMRVKALKKHKDRTDLKMKVNEEGKLEYAWEPESKKNGLEFMKWRNDICTRFGYHDSWAELNSANLGEYTSRNRLFGCFAKGNLPIIFPTATHAQQKSTSQNQAALHLFDQPLEPWKKVRDVLDLYDQGHSIFDRKNNMALRKQDRHDLAETTLARYLAGGIKFVAGGRDQYQAGLKNLVSYPGNKPGTTVYMLNQPNIKDESNHSFFANYYSNGGEHRSLNEPAPTFPTKDRVSLVNMQPTQWLDKKYQGEANHQSIEQPAGALLKKDTFSILTTQPFIVRDFSGGGQVASVDKPAGALPTVPKMNLAHAWLLSTHYGNVGSSLESPAPVFTAGGKYHYLVNPQYNNVPASIEKPCFTLIAQTHKRPPYLVTLEESGSLAIEVYDTDSPKTKELKIFMAAFGICDIKMRMLKIKEMLKIQGFPEDYVLRGSLADQKKFIGNSVVPGVVKRWAEAMAVPLLQLQKRRIA